MSERDWTTRTPEPGETIEAEGLTIRCEQPGGATLLSGDLDAAIAELAPGARVVGLLGELPALPHALRIARDRALLCTDAPLDIVGWHGTYASSSADDLFVELTITGRRAPEIQSACMSAEAGSPSAATLFSGHGALVAAVPGGLSLRVQRPEAAALWARLDALTRAL